VDFRSQACPPSSCRQPQVARHRRARRT